MSVLLRLRKESPFEVRDLAGKIEIKVIKICMNEKYFPKRYRFVLTMHIIEDAHKMVDYIEAANNTPNDTDFHKRRLTYQREAYIKAEALLRKFALAEELGFTIPDGILTELGTMLTREESLIQNWIKSDKKKLGL